MSALTEMQGRLRRLNDALAAVKDAQAELKSVFPVGTRIEFDKGNMVLCRGVIISVCGEGALVEPDEEIDDQGSLLVDCEGQVRVPWAWLFTLDAAAEMHKVRDPLIGV